MKYRLVVTLSAACGLAWGAAALLRTGKSKEGNVTASHPNAQPGFIPSGLDQEIKRVEEDVDKIEQQAIAQWRALSITSSTRMDQMRLLGNLLLF
jgi:hypothetical protein